MKSRTKEISTSELLHRIDDKNIKIIDIRTPEAYNGWTLEGEARGGHIKYAKSLPAKWLKYIDWIEMVRHKNIQPQNEIIIYGYDDHEMDHTASRFLSSGYKNISVYKRFADEWSPVRELPMQHLFRYHNLISARQVHKLMNEGDPLLSMKKPVVLHTHYRNRDAYLGGHIPGAVDLDTLALESPHTWNRRSPSELEKALCLHGISQETMVVLYGRDMNPVNSDPFPGSAAGDLAAMRCALIMLYAGVKDVRILNGGFQSWTDEGFPVDKTDVPKQPVKSFGRRIPAHPEYFIDTPEAKTYLISTQAELVCVRSLPEYTGEVSGYNYIEKKGRIPGAVYADCGSDAYHMENYRNFDNTTREYHEIEEIWAENGITPDKKLAFYCGTGWRGSEAWFNAWLMGWPDISVYDGGWFEWASDPANPIETGLPENFHEMRRIVTNEKNTNTGYSI